MVLTLTGPSRRMLERNSTRRAAENTLQELKRQKEHQREEHQREEQQREEQQREEQQRKYEKRLENSKLQKMPSKKDLGQFRRANRKHNLSPDPDEIEKVAETTSVMGKSTLASKGIESEIAGQLLHLQKEKVLNLVMEKFREMMGYMSDDASSEGSSEEQSSTADSTDDCLSEHGEAPDDADDSITQDNAPAGLQSSHTQENASSNDKGKKRAWLPSNKGDQDEGDRRHRPRVSPSTDFDPKKKLACPYSKKFPRHSLLSNTCTHGFTNTNRVKEHLKRQHALPDVYCGRCYKGFKTPQELATHLESETSTCPGPRTPPETKFGVEERIKLGKRQRNMTEIEKWIAIWLILFTDPESQANIPSPYADDRIFVKSPPNHELTSFEQFQRYELPRLVEEHFQTVLEANRQTTAENLISNMSHVIRSIQEQHGFGDRRVEPGSAESPTVADRSESSVSTIACGTTSNLLEFSQPETSASLGVSAEPPLQNSKRPQGVSSAENSDSGYRSWFVTDIRSETQQSNIHPVMSFSTLSGSMRDSQAHTRTGLPNVDGLAGLSQEFRENIGGPSQPSSLQPFPTSAKYSSEWWAEESPLSSVELYNNGAPINPGGQFPAEFFTCEDAPAAQSSGPTQVDPFPVFGDSNSHSGIADAQNFDIDEFIEMPPGEGDGREP